MGRCGFILGGRCDFTDDRQACDKVSVQACRARRNREEMAMANFEEAFKVTMGNEGGASFNPADLGNIVKDDVVIVPTYRGIAPVYHKEWAGFPIILAAAKQLAPMPKYGTAAYGSWVKKLNAKLAANLDLQDKVKTFYRVNYWDANRLGEIQDAKIARKTFDIAVNEGSVRWMQEAAGCKADGVCGPMTIKAINAQDPTRLFTQFVAVAKEHREAFVEKHPDQKQFLKEWLRRDASC